MEVKILKKVRETVMNEVIETVEFEYPTEHKFYKMVDDGRFFARGIVLFAILVKGVKTFNLYEIEDGEQFSTDFIPTKDCKQDDFLKSESSIRRTALKIMMNEDHEFTEITKEEFLETRDKLLSDRLMESLNRKIKV